MSQVNPRAELDQVAKVQQMKINARLVSLETALKLMHTPNYSFVEYKNDPDKPGSDSIPSVKGGTVDQVTLIATAQMVEEYILGDIEEESKKALEEAAKRFNAPKIVRP